MLLTGLPSASSPPPSPLPLTPPPHLRLPFPLLLSLTRTQAGILEEMTEDMLDMDADDEELERLGTCRQTRPWRLWRPTLY